MPRCNPTNPKSENPSYRCNEATGRWIKARTTAPAPCDMTNPKARNPLYRCNEATGRWIKVRAARRPSVISPPDYHLMPVMHLRYLAAKLHNIKGRTKMNKAELVVALTHSYQARLAADAAAAPVQVPAAAPVAAPAQQPQQSPAAAPVQQFQVGDAEQWWTSRCGNEDGTLQSQEWKDVPKKDIVRFGGFCFTISEICEIIHRSFTSLDTSYSYPPRRLQTPKDPFTRTPFTLDFFIYLRKKIKKDTTIPEYPEVLYFLRNVEKFYVWMRDYLPMRNPDKRDVSYAIENFLEKDLSTERTGFGSSATISWVFKKQPTQQKPYLYIRGH